MTLLFIGCGIQEVKYQNQKLGFEVSHPSDWVVKESISGVSFILFQENLPFPNFSVDVSEQNPEYSEDEIFSTISNYSTGEKITVSGYPGVKISSDFGQTQIFVLKKKNLYILTLTFPKEQENDFFETKNLIINSFNLI